jgi:hypothetical protein
LKRLILPVPVLTPRLSSLWLGLVTPLYVRVGRKLIDSIRHPTVVGDPAALSEFNIRPRGYREAMREAIAEEHRGYLTDSRSVHVSAPPERAFTPIRGIGGAAGWYYGDWLWKLRGAVDIAFGGVGLRRGRRHPDELRTGDIVDCWRVEAYEPGRLLRLAAEMKLPGRAWLEFEVTGDSCGSTIRQTATFDALGLLGRAYWYGVYPLHNWSLKECCGKSRRAPCGKYNRDHRLEACRPVGPLKGVTIHAPTTTRPMTARERIEATLRGELPDRVPIFDLIQHVPLIEHVTGRKLTPSNALDLLCRTIGERLDITRGIAPPAEETVVRYPDGFVYKQEWWTTWLIERPFKDTAGLLEYIRRNTEEIYNRQPGDMWSFAGKSNVWGTATKSPREYFLELQEKCGPNTVLFPFESPWAWTRHTSARAWICSSTPTPRSPKRFPTGWKRSTGTKSSVCMRPPTLRSAPWRSFTPTWPTRTSRCSRPPSCAASFSRGLRS